MGVRVFGRVVFDGVDLVDFGVTLSGVGTFNAPERDVEYKPVPGRNGDIILDNGRYNNISVTYPVNIETHLPGKVRALSEFLMSHKGYFRLEDSYHPDEFRMAQFAGPIDINSTGRHNRYGTTSLTFNCMPQRFLKSGELPVAFTDSSKAQQTIYQYSDMSNATKTNIIAPISAAIHRDLTNSLFYVVDLRSVTLAEDTMIRVEGGFDDFFVALCSDNPVTSSNNTSTYRTMNTFLIGQSVPTSYWLFPAAANIKIYAEDTLVYDSPNTEHETMHNQTMFGAKPLVKVDIADGDSITDYLFSIGPNGVLFTQPDEFPYNRAQTITIDCEAMEAYSLPRDNPAGYKVNWNPYVTFVKAPELMPGDNDIAYDATVSNLRIIPRWWRL